MIKKEFDLGIQYLRGGAALFVVLFHLRSLLDDVIPGLRMGELIFGQGAAGVDIFFIISGYIIAFSTNSKNSSSPKLFALKRLFRIYPTFLICLLLFIFVGWLHGTIFSFSDLLRSFLFIHKDYNQAAPFFGYNLLYPAWTLTYEIYFYAIFMGCMAISSKHRILTTTIFILLFSSGIQFFIYGKVTLTPYLYKDDPNGFFDFLANPMMYEFIIGMWLYRIRNHMPKGSTAKCIYIFFTVFSIFALASGVRGGHGLNGYGLWATIIVACVIFAERCGEIKNIFLLHIIGDVSYSLYLSHIIIIDLSLPILHYYGFNSCYLFVMILCLCLTTSLIIYNVVEKKSISLGRELIKRMNIKQTLDIHNYN